MAKALLQFLILLCLLKPAIVINKQDQPQETDKANTPDHNPQDTEIEDVNIDGHTIPISDNYAGHDYFAQVSENLESHHEQAIAQEFCTEHTIRLRSWQESDQDSNDMICSIPSRLTRENNTGCSINQNNGNFLDQQHVPAEEAELQAGSVGENRHHNLSFAHDQFQQAEASEQDNPVGNGTGSSLAVLLPGFLYSTDFLRPKDPAQRQQERASEQGSSSVESQNIVSRDASQPTPSAANGQQQESTDTNAAEFLQLVEQAVRLEQAEAEARDDGHGESTEHQASHSNFVIAQHSNDQQLGIPMESEPIQHHTNPQQVQTTALARWHQFDGQGQDEMSANTQAQSPDSQDKPSEEEDQAARARRELRRHLIIRYDHNGRATAAPHAIFGPDFQAPYQLADVSDRPNPFRYYRPHGSTPRRRNEGGDQLDLPGVRMAGRGHAGESIGSLLDTVGHESDPLAGMLQRLLTTQPSEEYRQLQLQNISRSGYGHDGRLDWRIHDYTHMMQRAVSGQVPYLYSEPFYTLEGYKLVAKIYLNGKGRGANSHVSLYFAIRRSHDDWHLEWPFPLSVTMTLVDQETGLRHISETIWPDSTSSSFQRPSEEMNVASGCPLFFSHAQLNNSNYIKDDIMHLKFSVDPLQYRDPNLVLG